MQALTTWEVENQYSPAVNNTQLAWSSANLILVENVFFVAISIIDI